MASKAAVTVLPSPVILIMLSTVYVPSQVDLFLRHLPCKASKYHYPVITDDLLKRDSESLKS